MAIYGISDLHLSFGTNKPMDIFGNKWKDYEDKIKENWNNTVNDNDTVTVNVIILIYLIIYYYYVIMG